MKFIKQGSKLPVKNFDGVHASSKVSRHGKLFPDSIRAIFAAPSNSGKTNTLLALLLEPNGLRFENIYLYGKTTKQPKYEFLRKVIEPIEGMEFHTFDNDEDVIALDKVKPHSIMVCINIFIIFTP